MINNPILSLVGQSSQQRWKSTLTWCLIMSIFGLLFTSMYESFSSQIEMMAEDAPELLEAVWGGNVSQAGTPEGWLGIELYGLLLPIVSCILAIIIGTTLANEENSGTLELLLSSPISRTHILLGRALLIITQLLFLSSSAWMSIFIGTLLFDFPVSLSNVFEASVMVWLLGISTGILTLCVQSLSGRKEISIMISAGYVSFSYVANLLPKLINDIDSIKYISHFYYADPGLVVTEGVDLVKILVLLVASLIFLTFSVISFKKRDTGIN